jgi:hypothetical protein
MLDSHSVRASYVSSTALTRQPSNLLSLRVEVVQKDEPGAGDGAGKTERRTSTGRAYVDLPTNQHNREGVKMMLLVELSDRLLHLLGSESSNHLHVSDSCRLCRGEGREDDVDLEAGSPELVLSPTVPALALVARPRER